jgi:hypothetical protein
MGLALFLMRRGENGPAWCPLPGLEPLEVEAGEMIYLLGRREDRPCPHCDCLVGAYHIQGVFTDPAVAVEAAVDADYFVGPLMVNVALPHHTVDWPGLWWPLRERPGDEHGQNAPAGTTPPATGPAL